MLAGVSLTEYGLFTPACFASLELSNSEITSMTSFTLNVTVGGSDVRKMNISAFEALLYSAAQDANNYPNSSGIPVSFIFGWLDEHGNVLEYLSYQGFTLTFKVSTDGMYMRYSLKGYASLSLQSNMPVLRIPALSGFVQPSAVVEALAKSVKATSYYELDIDHSDNPTLINHGPLTTSFHKYVRGTYSGKDDYDEFPGLLALSKSYSASREAAGIRPGFKTLNSILNNHSITPVESYLKRSCTDSTPQCASFTYWVDEPTMTSPGIIHYKSNASLQNAQSLEVLEYGTSNTNILSLSGSYDGVAYNMTDMNFRQVGFTVDGSGNSISQGYEVVNSWSSSLPDVYQASNIINDINALATQFSSDFNVTILGSTKEYSVAQPVSLLVMSGNTLSPVTGVYNIVSVSHQVSNQFVTTLRLKRLVMSSASQVASSQGILVAGKRSYSSSTYSTTPNIISPYKVEFGDLYPNFEHIASGF